MNRKIIPAALLLGVSWTYSVYVLLDLPLNFSRRVIITTILWLGLFCFLSYLFLFFGKTILRRSAPTHFWLYAIISLLLGGALLTFSPFPVTRTQVLPGSLEINALSPANGSECAVLLGFRGDGDYISYNAMDILGWQRRENQLIQSTDQNSLTWHGYARDIQLIFRSTQATCPVKVTWNNKSVTYELFQAQDPVLIHEVYQHPALIQASLLFFTWLFTSSIVFASIIFILIAWTIPQNIAPLPVEGETRRMLPQGALPWVFLAALAGAGLYLVASNKFGAFFATDSISYFSAARSLVNSEGYIMMNGDTFDWWPPLYPLLLSPAYWIKGIDPFLYARWLNAICLFSTLAGFGILLFHLIPSMRRWTVLALILLAAISPAILGTFIYLLSEAIFLPAIIWFFVFLFRYIQSHSARDAVLLSLFAGLAALTRYIGITVVFVAVTAVLFTRANTPLLARFFRAAACGFFASFPTFFWLAHNWILSRELTGLRVFSRIPLADNLLLVSKVISGWFAPQWEILALVLFILLLCLYLISLRRQNFTPHPPEVNLLIFFIFVYSLYLAWSLSVVSNAPISNRLMSPVYLPLLLVSLFLLDRIRNPRFPHSGLTILLLAAMIVPGVSTLVQVSRLPVITEADILSIHSLENDPFLQLLRQKPLDGMTPVYSNCPRCLCLYLGIYNAQILDETPASQPYLPQEDRPFTLIWFTQVNSLIQGKPEGSYTHPLPDLTRLLNRQVSVESIETTETGGVYFVRPGTP